MAAVDNEEVVTKDVNEDHDPFQTQEIKNEIVAPKPAVVAEKVEAAAPAEAAKPATETVIPTTKSEEATKPEVKAEPTTEGIKFANDFSAKLFEYLKEGKEEEVFNFLQEKKTLASIDKLSAEEQIKLNLQYQHPEYSHDEVQALFEDTYERPEKPVKDDLMDDEEYNDAVTKWEKSDKKFQNKLNREAKEARKFLTEKRSELILPDIKQAAIEPTQEELDRQDKAHKAYLQAIDKGISEFNGFETVYKDEEVSIPIKFTINDEDRGQLKPDLQNFNVVDFYREQWLNEDGSWNGKKYAEDVFYLKNRDKILQKVANEAGAQRLAAHIKAQKNIDYSGGRQEQTTSNRKAPNEELADFFFQVR